jgi:hypothetical protein
VRRGPAVTLKGFVGSEKANFLDNPRVRDLLISRYGIILDYSKAGSIEMLSMESTPAMDFLWPSSQVALELYREQKSGAAVKSELIFNSPIVLYSWDRVAEALIVAGIVRQEGATFWVEDFRRLLGLVLEGKAWSELGLAELYGKVSLVSTDPARSNSGNMFAGLAANILHGEVVDAQSLETVLPKLGELFARMGYQEHSTGILFEQYLQKGMGAYPLIVGYENQIVEFSLQNPQAWPKVKDRMRILYPVPTVWSSHPLIAQTPPAGRLIEALKDPDLQRLAWEKHGFRTGLLGVQNDPGILAIEGIPAEVTKIIPMPNPRVMQRITQELGPQ